MFWVFAARTPGASELSGKSRGTALWHGRNFISASPRTSVLFGISISDMFVSSAASLIPTHHWYSLLKANSSRNHLGPPRDAWIPLILKRRWRHPRSEIHPVTAHFTSPYGASAPPTDFLSCLQRGPLRTWFIWRAAVSARICAAAAACKNWFVWRINFRLMLLFLLVSRMSEQALQEMWY